MIFCWYGVWNKNIYGVISIIIIIFSRSGPAYPTLSGRFLTVFSLSRWEYTSLIFGITWPLTIQILYRISNTISWPPISKSKHFLLGWILACFSYKLTCKLNIIWDFQTRCFTCKNVTWPTRTKMGLIINMNFLSKKSTSLILSIDFFMKLGHGLPD